ncbi:MAG: hypothetical protein LC104_06280 [Bacteroidales bacterium]|nr:hypothetical protein [Bacteroidales bacterium]
MVFFIHPNLCLFFFRDPERKFTPDRLKQVLDDDGVTVTGEKQPFALRWGDDGPVLYVSIERGEAAEILASRLMDSRDQEHRGLIAGCDTYIEITFESLDEVLDEINTLIVVQSALQQVTGGLMYRSWNQTFSGPED